MERFKFNDGGRAEAGFKGTTGDCFVRSAAIASGKPYIEVYNGVIPFCNDYMSKKRKRRSGTSHPRTGIHKEVAHSYLTSLGFKWVPLMKIGTGCVANIDDFFLSTYLAKGSYILSLSKHYAAVVDGIVQDTYDPSRGGTRCIYGYFVKN